ncbi:MAG: hypothetical protein AAFO69_10285, partial [Bacteroidota bacterium]
PVTFIYLSMDKSRPKWLAAQQKAELMEAPNSYLTVNALSAQFFKNHNISAIPRYLLYDQNGQLVSNDAPSPSDDHIEELIQKILDQDRQ